MTCNSFFCELFYALTMFVSAPENAASKMLLLIMVLEIA